ncbi:MAG: HNH endonuclease, partial [Mediterranea sp.]|nr:HNH endonuclease [Mediterranea sp.]
MKRILITDKLKLVADKYKQDLCAMNGETPLDRLQRLKRSMKQNKYKEYIDAIINNYDDIVTLKPSVMLSYQSSHAPLNLPKQDLNKKFRNPFSSKPKGRASNKKFWELIVLAMKYDDARVKFVKYVPELGVKACVYCNAQFAITSVDNLATYTLDHINAKSTYPFLCTSFFNLIPCCASCNSMKKQGAGAFSPYTEDYSQEFLPFEFELEKRSLL